MKCKKKMFTHTFCIIVMKRTLWTCMCIACTILCDVRDQIMFNADDLNLTLIKIERIKTHTATVIH